MPKFAVAVREVHVSLMVVEADTMDEAVSRVEDGEGEEILCEYGHTLGTDTWSVQKWDRHKEMSVGPTFYYNEATGKFDKKVG